MSHGFTRSWKVVARGQYVGVRQPGCSLDPRIALAGSMSRTCPPSSQAWTDWSSSRRHATSPTCWTCGRDRRTRAGCRRRRSKHDGRTLLIFEHMFDRMGRWKHPRSSRVRPTCRPSTRPRPCAWRRRCCGGRRRAELDDLVVAAHWAALHSTDPRHEGGKRVWAEDRLITVGGEGSPRVREFCIPELAMVRQVHPLTGQALIADALDLQHRLPLVWARVASLEAEAGWRARSRP